MHPLPLRMCWIWNILARNRIQKSNWKSAIFHFIASRNCVHANDRYKLYIWNVWSGEPRRLFNANNHLIHAFDLACALVMNRLIVRLSRPSIQSILIVYLLFPCNYFNQNVIIRFIFGLCRCAIFLHFQWDFFFELNTVLWNSWYSISKTLRWYTITVVDVFRGKIV